MSAEAMPSRGEPRTPTPDSGMINRLRDGLIPRATLRSLALVLAVTLLQAGCSGENGSGRLPASEAPTTTISPPEFLLGRAVDLDALRIDVRIDDQTTEARRIESDRWQVSFVVAPNQSATVTVTWYELYEEALLPLAQWSQTITGTDSDRTINITADEYDTENFDDDGDGVSNLDERENGTRPTSGSGTQDTDGDGVSDNVDICPLIANPIQIDIDFDGIGDECDSFDDYGRIAGLWDASYPVAVDNFGNVIGRDVVAVLIDLDGAYTVYDYDGDEADFGENCWYEESFYFLTQTGTDEYRFDSDGPEFFLPGDLDDTYLMTRSGDQLTVSAAGIEAAVWSLLGEVSPQGDIDVLGLLPFTDELCF